MPSISMEFLLHGGLDLLGFFLTVRRNKDKRLLDRSINITEMTLTCNGVKTGSEGEHEEWHTQYATV